MIEHGIVCVLVCSGPDRLVVGRFFITELVFCGLTMRSRYCDECSMRTTTTTIINYTTQILEIMEGSAGVWTCRARLIPGQAYGWTNDPNATYKEAIIQNEAQEVIFCGELCDFTTFALYVTLDGSVACHGAEDDKSLYKRKVLICIHTPHCMYSRVLFNSLLFTKSYHYN